MPGDDFWDDMHQTLKKRKPLLGEPTATRAVKSKKTLNEEPVPPETIGAWSGRTIFAAIIAVALAVLLGIGAVLWSGMSARADQDATGLMTFTVAQGEHTRGITARLEEDGIVVSQWPALMYLVMNQATLQAGTFELSSAMTTREVVDQLTGGKLAQHRITLLEGWRLEQMAVVFDAATIVSSTDFLAAAQYDPTRHTLPTGMTLTAGASLEGLLFPDTYVFPIGVTAEGVVDHLFETFVAKTASLELTYDDIILASIVEREAQTDEDRAQVAGVYTNRLNISMKLDADPTVQYAKDTVANATAPLAKWWSPITVADYREVVSSYNTYLNGGLPPGPIAAPGLASLQAAVEPADHDFFYFLHRSDGTTVYSKTKAEHDRARANL